jgi:mRNA-degrading endonuclease RelE of RelBE toxin-antitoxin system
MVRARYTIRYERDAELDLDFLGWQVEARVRRAIGRYLADQPVPVPGQEGARKELDENPLGAEYRLRVDEYRVYYYVEGQTVQVLRVGHKPRETVYLRGKPFPMRE